MNKSIQLFGGLLLSVGLLVACGDDTEDAGGGASGGGGSGAGQIGGGGSGAGDIGGGGSDTGGGGGGDGPPEKGAGIDRMGRPAINTALNGAFIQFDENGAAQASDNTQRAEEEDEYNESTQPGDWEGDYTAVFAANMAILDALDDGLVPEDTECSNPTTCVGGSASATCYNLVAGALTNDRLFVNVDGECSAAAFDPEAQTEVGGYLAVEAATLNDDLDLVGCGGRRPIDDVIETTYSLLALGGLTGFDDGVTAETVPENSHIEVFPYIGEPL